MNLLQGLGQAQPVTGFINTALNVQQSQNQAALLEQQQKLNEIKLAQDERNNEYLDVTEVLRKAQEKGHGGAVDLGIKRSMDLGLHKEVPGPDGAVRTFMRRSDIAAGVDAISKDTKAQPAILADRENYLTAQMDALEKKAGDPKIKAQYDELAAERRMVRKKLYGLDEDKGTVVAPGATLVRPGQPDFTAPKEQKVVAILANENGDIVRQMEDGALLNSIDDPYEGDPSGLIKIGQDKPPKEPTSPDSVWLSDWAKANPTATPQQRMKAIEAYNKQKVEFRIPAFTQAQGFPPGYIFNRRTGSYDWKGEGQAPGMSPETVATYQADKASLANVTKGMDTIMSFKRGVTSSLQLVDKLQEKFARSNIPGIAKLSQYIQYNAGDPDVKAFQNAVTTAMTEYMKVTTAGMGLSSQELTQMAQQRAKTLLEISDNPQTFKNSTKVMYQEMDIKDKAFKAQRAEIQGRLQGGGNTGGGVGKDPLGLGL